MRLGMVLVMLLSALAACGSEDGRVRKRECEAVLAHLTVLERGESDQPMCKYHPDCAGDRADRYERSCQKVLTRSQADCYLRATTLDGADDCLRRAVFDDELRTGRKINSSGGGGGGGGDDDPWFGGGGNGGSPLGQMRDLRDQACACKDAACAERIQKRFEDWARDNATTTTKPDEALMDVAMEATECMTKAMGSGSYGGYYDAGVPDAYGYGSRDPYGWRPGSTGMPACDQYIELVDDLMSCDKYPATARQAVKDSIDSMRSSWGDPTYMSDAVKESTNDSCRMMLESTQQAMTAMGCP